MNVKKMLPFFALILLACQIPGLLPLPKDRQGEEYGLSILWKVTEIQGYRVGPADPEDEGWIPIASFAIPASDQKSPAIEFLIARHGEANGTVIGVVFIDQYKTPDGEDRYLAFKFAFDDSGSPVNIDIFVNNEPITELLLGHEIDDLVAISDFLYQGQGYKVTTKDSSCTVAEEEHTDPVLVRYVHCP